MKKRFLSIPMTFLLLALASCSKDADDIMPEIFYGKWKTSYGDTMVFSRANGKNIATYNFSMNTLLPARADHEFTYRDGKLGTKISATSDFKIYSSFRWLQADQSFEIQANEWFGFVNSLGSYFTFTKMP